MPKVQHVYCVEFNSEVGYCIQLDQGGGDYGIQLDRGGGDYGIQLDQGAINAWGEWGKLC